MKKHHVGERFCAILDTVVIMQESPFCAWQNSTSFDNSLAQRVGEQVIASGGVLKYEDDVWLPVSCALITQAWEMNLPFINVVIDYPKADHELLLDYTICSNVSNFIEEDVEAIGVVNIEADDNSVSADEGALSQLSPLEIGGIAGGVTVTCLVAVVAIWCCLHKGHSSYDAVSDTFVV
jgi:hypothetical protein